MARNGSGTQSSPAASYPAVASTLIESAKFNAVIDDINSEITNSIAVDGQSVVTANIPLGGFKLTGVGAGTAATDAATLANIQNGTGGYVATVGGTADAITLTPSPAITAYAAGQTFSFIAASTNTSSVTVAVSGLATRALTKNGSTALVAGNIVAGSLVTIRDDGTRYQLLTPVFAGSSSQDFAINNATIAGTLTVTGATTSALTTISAVAPALRLTETDAAAGNQRWDLIANGEVLELRALNDAATVAGSAITINRTGTTIDDVAIGGPLSVSAGVVFPATQNAIANVNTLDDYEEGTWTPSVGGTATYTSQTGWYRKIGSLVTISAVLDINVIGTGSGSTITGIPFTEGGGILSTVSFSSFDGLTTSVVFLTGSVNSTSIGLTILTAAATATTNSSVMGNGTTLYFTATYRV